MHACQQALITDIILPPPRAFCCSHGPSLMPGGPREAYDLVKDVLELTAGEWWSSVTRTFSRAAQPQPAVIVLYVGVCNGCVQPRPTPAPA